MSGLLTKCTNAWDALLRRHDRRSSGAAASGGADADADADAGVGDAGASTGAMSLDLEFFKMAMRSVNRVTKNQATAAASAAAAAAVAEQQNGRWGTEVVSQAAERAVAFFQEPQVWVGDRRARESQSAYGVSEGIITTYGRRRSHAEPKQAPNARGNNGASRQCWGALSSLVWFGSAQLDSVGKVLSLKIFPPRVSHVCRCTVGGCLFCYCTDLSALKLCFAIRGRLHNTSELWGIAGRQRKNVFETSTRTLFLAQPPSPCCVCR